MTKGFIGVMAEDQISVVVEDSMGVKTEGVGPRFSGVGLGREGSVRG